MWKHKNFINLQLYAGPQPFVIYMNGEPVVIQRLSDSMVPGEETWSYNASINTDNYTISGNTVVWSDGTILQYNGVDVLPTDTIEVIGQYTTRSATPTLTFKHFYDAGTIGSGTYKFRHYSQQEPSSATLINFTINGTAYQAEEGMTWQQWVNSSYNTYGCTIERSSVKGKGNNGSPTYIYINQNLNLTLVSSTDSIIKNATYEDAAGGAGN